MEKLSKPLGIPPSASPVPVLTDRRIDASWSFLISHHHIAPWQKIGMLNYWTSPTASTSADMSNRAVFIKCDVTSWTERASAFETAVKRSPSGRIDIVIANAGIAGPDVLSSKFRPGECEGVCVDRHYQGLDAEALEPPQTKMIDVNITGVLYTTRLAGRYFTRGQNDPSRGCLVLISSIMRYIDTQSSAIYATTKFAVRGLMCCLPRKGVFRVNLIAPSSAKEISQLARVLLLISVRMIETPIMSKDFIESVRPQFQEMGLDFALSKDAVTAVLRLVTDPTINGPDIPQLIVHGQSC